jgi:ribosome-associated protein
MDDPMSIGRDVKVPLREIIIRTSRSSGPGGQHANVTASRVEAIFDVEASSALTDEQKRRVISRAGARVTAVAQDARGQARNRELALERLRRRLTQALATPRHRQATRPTTASVHRRLDTKRRQAARKRDRQRPKNDD